MEDKQAYNVTCASSDKLLSAIVRPPTRACAMPFFSKKQEGDTTSHTHHNHKPSVTTVLGTSDLPDLTNLSSDEAALVALGYKQEFKREFSLWTCFCVSFAVLGLLPSFASTLYYGMGYAGTGGMVWGWLISWIFIQCIAMGMAELCSSMPTRYVEEIQITRRKLVATETDATVIP